MLTPADRLSYSEAEQVGLTLKKRWPSITRQSRAPRIADEQWADLVQAVMRHAGEVIAARAEPGE